MEPKDPKLCRLCLKILINTSFEDVDNLKLGMLDVLLLKLNFSVSGNLLICQRCMSCLKKSFHFKTACLSVEQQINHYVSAEKKIRVDLKEVYLLQKENEKQKVIREDRTICRFCLKLFENNALNEIGVDVTLMGLLREYFPELDLNISKPISACGNCLDSLINTFNFVMNCLDTEKHIKKYETVEKGISGQVNLHAVLKFMEKCKSQGRNVTVYNGEVIKVDEPLQNGLTDQKSVQSTVDNIKCEVIEIKSEPEDDESFQGLPTAKEKNTGKDCLRGDSKEKKAKKSLKSSEEPQVFTCKVCTFKTRHRSSLDNHKMVHKDPLDTRMYRCSICAFETKYKGSFTRHNVICHSSEATVYECTVCTFKGRHKCSLRMHMLTHREPSNVTLYKCAQCPYETKIRVNLPKHMLRHRSPSETPMYLCEICGFKSKHELSLKTHRLVHKSKSEIRMYKCDVCAFEAKHKGNLKKHMLVHKDRSEVTMFNCKECPFETKHKISLKTHMLRHKNPSEVVLFQCDICGFKARHRGNLKLHMVTHKDSSNTEMYKCEHCSFETKHKTSLKTHVLKHRLTDTVTYKCEQCDFETLYKGNLKKHSLVHKDASEDTYSFHPILSSCETLIEESTEELVLTDD